MRDKKQSGRIWVWGVTLTISAFIVFFVGLALWSFQSEVELVYDNYYEKDVVFEQQIKRLERTSALPVRPVIKYYRMDERIDLVFPSSLGHSAPEGELLLFRPSDLNLDRSFSLSLKEDTLQSMLVPELKPGLWRAKLSWTFENRGYYLEEPILVQ
jgi:hypothetical protein